MGKGKKAKFAEMNTFTNVLQFPFSAIQEKDFELKGHWKNKFFKNDNSIILELGCGKGEYTVGLARMFPNVNFIGVDIKGARMWSGAKQALTEQLSNVAFLRTNIEFIDKFFGTDEVNEIWLTFSDPQMKNAKKRLSSTFFLNRYRKFLVDGGIIHLKTDSNFLFTYTDYVIGENHLPLLFRTTDLYNTEGIDEETRKILGIRTYYESMWIERGIAIKYQKFRLVHDTMLTEPNVEIPKDEYRSYNRNAKSTSA